MDDHNRLGVRILAVGLVLGVLGDNLLRETPWGINFALWLLMLAAFVAVLGWRIRSFQGGGYALLIPILFFAGAFPFRDSLALNLLSVLALLVAFAVILLRAQGGALATAYLVDYVIGGILAGLNAGLGGFRLLIGDLPWRQIFKGAGSDRSLAVTCGVVLSLPLLLVFGALFVAADAVFAAIVKDVFWVDLRTLVTHIILTAFFAWIVCGYLRGVLLGKELAFTRQSRRQWFSLGITEIGIALGLLDLLFLSFVLVQFSYFFGGTASVTLTPGLTYSEYARRGFFELVAVSALVLPLLLFAHWVLFKDDGKPERIFRWLAGFQLVMLAVIMASAFQRMRLYQQEYGLTEQRLYPTAFMGWLAVVFAWFALTVLRGKRQYFACGAMVAGFVLIAALHVLNPDAFIVRVNAAHAAAGHKFDVNYATRLSADAVPELVAALPALPPKERCVAAARIIRRWAPPPELDWRTWNYSLSRALEIVRVNHAMLQQMACREDEPDMH